MKRYNDLYSQIYDLDNLEEAWRYVRLGKRYDKEVLQFGYDPLGNLIDIYNDLAWCRYKVGQYREFIIKDPKERLIQFLPLRDRIVQQALHQIIEPIFNAGFIDDSYACRRHKGTHKAMHRLQHYLISARRRWSGQDIYYLHCDIHKYFSHINHDILYSLFARKIKCSGTLHLIKTIIDSSTDSPGLPIGSLFSQLAANIYLNVVDQFVKHVLRARYYLRYMDNFVVVHNDKCHLLHIKEQIEAVIHSRLNLSYNEKMTRIDKAHGGIEFVGYRIYADQIKIKRASAERIKKHLRVMRAMYEKDIIPLNYITKRVASWLGHCKHANAVALTQKILNGVMFTKKSEVQKKLGIAGES